ncbi:hypothetical protein ACIA5G_39535 [Amycolatopsis sp. NPDC051758]|uniref:hypothetical protein n=1 Tax=Amycolatopsis sp. NPDC051758 TaxID=3363935 RepID=UPI003796FAFD
MTSTACAAGSPADDLFVLAGRALRPGVAVETTSRFADLVWDLGPAILQHHAGRVRLDFARVPQSYRYIAKQLCHALLSGPLPPDELRPATSTVRRIFGYLTRFLAWLDTQPPDDGTQAPVRLADVTSARLTSFEQHLRDSGVSAEGRAGACSAVRMLWRFRHCLTDGLTVDPAGLASWGVPAAQRQENTTPRIPEEVLGPLIGWALRFVRDFAPDIVGAADAFRDYRRPRRINRRGDNTGVGARIQQVLDHYVATGEPLPGYEHKPNLKFLAWQAGCHVSALYYGQRPDAVRAAAAIVGVASGSRLPVPIRGCLDGQPWLPGIPVGHPQHSVSMLGRILVVACYIVIAFFSGMRDGEIKHLRRGCLRVHRTADGTAYRWSVQSVAFKGERDPRGAPATWIIGEPAARAVEVLEQLQPGRSDALLFATLDVTTAPHTPEARAASGKVPSGATTNQQVRDFVAWVNRYCQAHDRGDAIPDVHGQPVRLRTAQFRRTLAWFIARRPGGSIAGAIQYRHLSIHMFEGYAGTSDSGFRAEVEAEQALARGEVLLNLATDHDHPDLTGPAAAEAGRRLDGFASAFAGTVVTDPVRLRRILRRDDPAIYPGEYVTCVFNPDTALCLTDRARPAAPELSACRPLDCANVALTRTNVAALRREAEHLTHELQPPSPLPPLLEHRLAERRDRITAYLARHTAETS